MSFDKKIRKFILKQGEFVADIKNRFSKKIYQQYSDNIRNIIIKIYGLKYYKIIYDNFINNSNEYKVLFEKKDISVDYVTLPWNPKAHQQALKLILSAKKVGFTKKINSDSVDCFCTWGDTISPKHDKIISLAYHYGRPLIRLEYGLISGIDIAALNYPQFSVLMSPFFMYYDSYHMSFMDYILNSDFKLSNEQYLYSKKCINLVLKNKLTKYNSCNKELKNKEFLKNNRRNILLIDQRKGDISISKGRCSQKTFNKMFKDAYKNTDCNILLKIHPDALKAGFGSYLSPFMNFDPERVFVINEDVNPYSLFEYIDEVYTAVSGMGFEAALAGKKVTCYGNSFYSSWGFTTDKKKSRFRFRSRDIVEFFYVYYVLCSRYYIPTKGSVEFKDFLLDFNKILNKKISIEKLRDLVNNDLLNSSNKNVEINTAIANSTNSLKLLFVIPSPRNGATGINVNILANNLISNHNCKVLVLSEGNELGDNGLVKWKRIRFNGKRLSLPLRQLIINFDPNIVYLWGCRTKAQRAALEALILSDAKLVTHYEDDDLQVAEKFGYFNISRDLIPLDDQPISDLNIINIFSEKNIKHLYNVYRDPFFDRWIDPLLRQWFLRSSAGFTSIWKPFHDKLSYYSKNQLILPPSYNLNLLHLFNSFDKNKILKEFNIPKDKLIIYINGSIYPYSDEFELFVNMLNILSIKYKLDFHFIFIAKTKEIKNIFDKTFNKMYSFSVFEFLNDLDFNKLIFISDILASPGKNDSFTKYRVPSRFVLPMFLGKTVLLNRCGFGESLKSGINSILFYGDNPAEWAEQVYPYLNQKTINNISKDAKDFAIKYFDPKKNADSLFLFLNHVCKNGCKPFE